MSYAYARRDWTEEKDVATVAALTLDKPLLFAIADFLRCSRKNWCLVVLGRRLMVTGPTGDKPFGFGNLP